MSFFSRLSAFFSRFMAGRNGVDNLGYASMIAGLVMSVLALFGLPLALVGKVLYVYAIFRLFSRNTGKRAEENRRFMEFTQRVPVEIRQFFLRLKGMKEYRYFRCPGCKTRLRLKRGCGEKRITCPVCRHQFDEKA